MTDPVEREEVLTVLQHLYQNSTFSGHDDATLSAAAKAIRALPATPPAGEVERLRIAEGLLDRAIEVVEAKLNAEIAIHRRFSGHPKLSPGARARREHWAECLEDTKEAIIADLHSLKDKSK